MSRNYKRNVIFAVIIACSVLLSACAILEVSEDPSESMTNVATEPTTAPEKPEDSANEETKENVTEDTYAGPDDSSCATQPTVSDDNGGEGKDDVEETKPADTETSVPTEAPATEATEVPTTEATEVPATEATEPESKPNLWLEPVEPTVADTTAPAASDPLAPETDAMEKNEAGESVPEETVPVETTPSVPEPDPVDLVYSAGKSEEVLAEINVAAAVDCSFPASAWTWLSSIQRSTTLRCRSQSWMQTIAPHIWRIVSPGGDFPSSLTMYIRDFPPSRNLLRVRPLLICTLETMWTRICVPGSSGAITKTHSLTWMATRSRAPILAVCVCIPVTLMEP